MMAPLENMVEQIAFDSFGILETILSYSTASELCQASLVGTTWHKAARNDGLWALLVQELRKKKKGRYETNQLFWRTLYTNEAMERLSPEQIRSIFNHPLLLSKRKRLEKESLVEKNVYRFYRVHTLDVMSLSSRQSSIETVFFRDIQFGCYASSIMDSKRKFITEPELCTPHGFDMYFKISTHDIEDDDRPLLEDYDEDNTILLYHHSTCFFDDEYEFHIVLNQEIQSYHPTGT
jgi:hypothetical protein